MAIDGGPGPFVVAFVEAERARLARGEPPPWRIEHVMVGVYDSQGQPASVYAMKLALIECDGADHDVRNLVRARLARHGAQPGR